MTAQELADDMKAEQLREYGSTPDGTGIYGFPSKYFNLNVTVTQPDGSKVQRSPRYCASDGGAVALQSVMDGSGENSTIVPGDAQAQGGGFTDSQQVPFLQFENGDTVNAALMLEHFTHGYPGDLALGQAESEIGI